MSSVPQSPSEVDLARLPEDVGSRPKVNVLVVSSVALAFISFWRAAAIVLCDLASTAYYIGGISEQAIGKAAPWFILGVMLFSYAVRAVYVESCTMFTRGGVYKVVKQAMGGTLAKLSVSALMFDYILTGPISAVSAGQYMVGLGVDMINLILHFNHMALIDQSTDRMQEIKATVTVGLSLAITVYFWWVNIKGIHESSDQALRIMQLTTVMGVIIIAWSALSLWLHPEKLVLPPMHPVFTDSGLAGANESSKGWLEHLPRLIGTFGILIAFGHTLLAMSGEESLAQVNREIEAPKLKNLLRAGFVIFLYSLLLTGLISFLAVFIIPDGKRVMTQVVQNGTEASDANRDKSWVEVDYLRAPDATHPANWGLRMQRVTDDSGEQSVKPVSPAQIIVLDANHHVQRDDGGYRDNLINGLVQYLAGPPSLKIVMECFVVVVGFLILAGAVNTSIVGANGVLNRLAEDGVLTPWFLHPQPRYGTTHRLINLVVILQLLTILASWGNVNQLGEAYAFGVIWSFVFKTLAMVVLRFKDKTPRQYEVPLNIRLHSKDKAKQLDLPIGIVIIFLILFSTAMINLVTKETATIWGVGFTAGFMIAFVTLEQISHRRMGKHHTHLEQFNEKSSESVTIESLGLMHPNPILLAARGPRSLPVLERVLKETDTDVRDVVVVTCKVLPARTQGVTDYETSVDEGDRELLTQIVTVAEEVGKQVHPVVLPTNNPLFAIAIAARDLKATEVVLGVSEKVHAEVQLEQFALAWGSATADPMYAEIAGKLTIRIIGPNVEMKYQMD